MLKRLVKFKPKPTWSNNEFWPGSSGSDGGLGEGSGHGGGLGEGSVGLGKGVIGGRPKHLQRLHGDKFSNTLRTVKIKKLFCCKYCRKLGNAKI